MDKRLLFLLIPLALLCALLAVTPKTTNGELAAVNTLTEPERRGLNFLRSKLQNEHGLIYYSVESNSPATYSVLESAGQAMEYAALSGAKQLFSEYAKQADRYYKDKTGYYYWKIAVAANKGETSSAFVDDLRLAKAYFIAHEKEMGDYTKQLIVLSDTIFKFGINDAGRPCEYYDGRARQKAKVIPLFYLDIDTMHKLSRFDAKWLSPYQHTRDILFAMPENDHGFYPVRYNHQTDKYVWNPSINMVENLYTALNAYNAGRDTRAFASFLRNQTRQGKIYNHYYLNGKPVNSDESTAVYALATRFLTLHSEREAAKVSYRRTLQFQIQDKNSFYGGFGESTTGFVYAFDQLEALIMLRMVEPIDVSQQ